LFQQRAETPIADASARSQARAVIVPRPAGVAATSSFNRSKLRRHGHHFRAFRR